MSWSFIDGTTVYTLPYGPKSVDYVVTSGTIRKKYSIIRVPMNSDTADSFSHIEEYPIYSMHWPIVTAALYAQLSLVPLHKTIILYDGVEERQFNIQIINIIISNLKTMRDTEVLRTITINFRLVGA